jgi:hypothetical protein
MMNLVFLPVNQAYAFIFGDSTLQISGEPRFFQTKREAIEAAKRHGLSVNGRGRVNPLIGCEV